MFNKNKNELKELAELCKPIMKFIANKSKETNENYSVIVNEDGIEMVKTELYGVAGFSFENTAQEVLVQEQYTCKCEHCGHDNDFKLSVHLPKGIHPKFCMKCGKDVKYIKKDIH